jgi:hypothetical protein
MKTRNVNSKKILMLGTALVTLHTLALTHTAVAASVSVSLTATTDLHFGRIAPAPGSAGTVTINTAGAQSFTGGIVDGGSIGIAQAAGFTVDGDELIDIQITAAPSALTGAGPAMALTTIKYSLGPTANTDTTTFQIPASHTTPLAFTVGATLSVANASTQTQGSYTGSIVLTANYM